jgi:hypothetical protein
MMLKFQSKEWRSGTKFDFFIIRNQLAKKAQRNFREIPKNSFRRNGC